MITADPPVRQCGAAALVRFSRLAPMERQDLAILKRATEDYRCVEAGTEIARESERTPRKLLLLRGWIAFQRVFADGRRQIVGFALPGEVFGRGSAAHTTALTSHVAVDKVSFCTAPDPAGRPSLELAYARDQLAQWRNLIDHTVRLGRMDARERVCDLLLELHERLLLSGEASENAFRVPLTQEWLADVVGLTPVHLNRTLQACRRDGILSWQGKNVVLHDPAAIARFVGRKPERIDLSAPLPQMSNAG